MQPARGAETPAELLQPLTIVTIGDSITKGARSGVTAQQTFASLAGRELRKQGRNVRVVNIGIGGERTDQFLKRLEQATSLQPYLVTVMYGTNDSYVDKGKSTTRITADAYRANLEKIVVEMRRRGIRLILMTPPRFADDARPNGLGENPNERLEPFAVVCREVAAKWRVPLVDHFAHWTAARAGGAVLREWTTDGCHPNPFGHAKIVQAMLPTILKTLGPPLKVRENLRLGKAVRVVCFGDSVTGVYYHTGSRRAYTDMLGIALRRTAPRATIEMVNAGVSGHTTVNALQRIERDVLAKQPDVVTVMFGLNDMTRVPLDQYRANLETIVKKCRDAGAEVILATPNNVTETASRPSDKLILYCDAVRQVAGKMQVALADCHQEMEAIRQHAPFQWRLLMSDPIHPNLDGHKKIAEQLAQTITAKRVRLDDAPTQQPALRRTFSRLQEKKPLRVLAMPPLAGLIKNAFAQLAPTANVEVTTWATTVKTLSELEQEAKSRVRAMKPDLVVLAVPRAANAASTSDEAFVHSFGWLMNWSLNFGPPTWDCVVVHPAVFETADAGTRDDLVRRLVGAQDLSLIDRPAGNKATAAEIFAQWIQQQWAERR